MSDQGEPVEPAPETGGAGTKPPAGEGQEPDQGTIVDDGSQEGDPEGRTYSQSYVKQLRKELKERREHEEELAAQLRQREDADKTESQKEREAREDAEKRAAEAELKLLRVEVGGEHGLPVDALKFLTGQTREEIELHAEELSKLLKQGKPATGFDGGARPKAPPLAKPPEEAHNELLLRAIGRHPEGRAS